MTIALPPETEQLARRVAARSGRTPEAVLRDGLAFEARLAGITPEAGADPVRRADVSRARAIARAIAARPILDRRSSREILDAAWGHPDDRRR